MRKRSHYSPKLMMCIPSTVILGFDKTYLRKLKTDGFQDLKTLIIYRNQFKLILDLINT